MTDRPIIFSAPMVKALLERRKTQTRRVLSDAPHGPGWHCDPADTPSGYRFVAEGGNPSLPCRVPHAVGDRLWVRESCRAEELLSGEDGVRFRADDSWIAIANTPAAGDRWLKMRDYNSRRNGLVLDGKGPYLPSIHLPRWASRLTLMVSKVRVQRLQDISGEDAEAEGIYFDKIGYTAGHMGGIGGCNQEWSAMRTIAFANLWRLLHTKEGKRWEDNPWIVAVSFDVVCGNIDEVAP